MRKKHRMTFMAIISYRLIAFFIYDVYEPRFCTNKQPDDIVLISWNVHQVKNFSVVKIALFTCKAYNWWSPFYFVNGKKPNCNTPNQFIYIYISVCNHHVYTHKHNHTSGSSFSVLPILIEQIFSHSSNYGMRSTTVHPRTTRKCKHSGIVKSFSQPCLFIMVRLLLLHSVLR